MMREIARWIMRAAIKLAILAFTENKIPATFRTDMLRNLYIPFQFSRFYLHDMRTVIHFCSLVAFDEAQDDFLYIVIVQIYSLITFDCFKKMARIYHMMI